LREREREMFRFVFVYVCGYVVVLLRCCELCQNIILSASV